MPLTSIADQLTPGRPIEITFGADLGIPVPNRTLVIIGHEGATPGTAVEYTVNTINNVTTVEAAKTEADGLFGVDSELSLMIQAAVRANLGGSAFPEIKAIPLLNTDTDFGATDQALTAAKTVSGVRFLVSPYDGHTDTTNGDALELTAQELSGAQRVENGQFGTQGVTANLSVADPSTLNKYDSEHLTNVYMRDTGTNEYTVGEMAAAYAAILASNSIPYNPLDDVVINGVEAPADEADFLTIGAGLESESALEQGWTPLKVFPNGNVAIVRSVTARRTVDGAGVTDVQSYFDVQDFDVLYFWRQTLFTRFSQTDFKRRKASEGAAGEVLSELIRLAQLFEDQEMFQAVSQLAQQFAVERALTDRHRFDYFTPVNVIPGLHVIAGNIEASTQFDVISI